MNFRYRDIFDISLITMVSIKSEKKCLVSNKLNSNERKKKRDNVMKLSAFFAYSKIVGIFLKSYNRFYIKTGIL